MKLAAGLFKVQQLSGPGNFRLMLGFVELQSIDTHGLNTAVFSLLLVLLSFYLNRNYLKKRAHLKFKSFLVFGGGGGLAYKRGVDARRFTLACKFRILVSLY